ncbi:MAG: acyl carrier protein [Desulfobacteraceae bacterium]|nr:acyl carrier protein [Desulfobacteraceae bacterium]
MHLEKQLKQLIIETAGLDLQVEDIKNDEFLLGGGLNLDSKIIIELVCNIEDTFEIVYEDEDITIENFNSVDCIAEYIKNRIGPN